MGDYHNDTFSNFYGIQVLLYLGSHFNALSTQYRVPFPDRSPKSSKKPRTESSLRKTEDCSTDSSDSKLSAYQAHRHPHMGRRGHRKKVSQVRRSLRRNHLGQQSPRRSKRNAAARTSLRDWLVLSSPIPSYCWDMD